MALDLHQISRIEQEHKTSLKVLNKIRILESIAWIERCRKPGETPWDAFRRIIIDYALKETDGNMNSAARMLNVSNRQVNYRVYRKRDGASL